MCIVAFADQWYLNYGDEKWSEKVREHVENDLECYSGAVKNGFLHTAGWLGDWACTRTMGLGTRLPWDEEWLIESLSDSTLYFAYYSIAYLLQGGDPYGKAPGPSGMTPDQCTPEFFENVLKLNEIGK